MSESLPEMMRVRGVSGAWVEGEMLRLLPGSFLTAYEELFLASFGSAGGGVSRDSEPNPVASVSRLVRTSTSQIEHRGPAVAGGNMPGASTRSVVASERALGIRASVDRKLRKLARDIHATLDDRGGVAQTRRCTQCRKFMEADWAWCPFDRARTEDV